MTALGEANLISSLISVQNAKMSIEEEGLDCLGRPWLGSAENGKVEKSNGKSASSRWVLGVFFI